MPFGKEDHRIARDLHRLPLLRLVGRLGIVQVIECSQVGRQLPFVVEHPFLIDLPVEGGMARRPLLHEFGKQSRLVGQPPCLRHVTEDPLPLRLARPVGNHLRAVALDILLRNGVALQFAGVEHVQILHAVAGELRKGRHALGLRTPLAHHQLPLAQVEHLPPAVVVKIRRPQHRDGQLSEVLLVKCRFVKRPLDGKRRFRLDTQLPQLLDPPVHARTFGMLHFCVKIPFPGRRPLG